MEAVRTGRDRTPRTAGALQAPTATRSCLRPRRRPSRRNHQSVSGELILLIRPARLIAFGFIILSCGRFKDSFTKVLVLSFCTRQETHPLLSKGGNQGALVLVELSFQIPSSFITELLFMFSSHSCFSYQPFFSFHLKPCHSHRREPEEGKVIDADPGDHVQHVALQPQPLQRANQL